MIHEQMKKPPRKVVVDGAASNRWECGDCGGECIEETMFDTGDVINVICQECQHADILVLPEHG